MTDNEQKALLAALAIYADALVAIALCETTTEDTSRDLERLGKEHDFNVELARQALSLASEMRTVQ